jgi:hypothetical protein
MKSLIIAALSFITVITNAQDYFEGKIYYVTEVAAKNKKVSIERLQHAVGNGRTLSFKEGNFRLDYDGGVLEFEVYRNDENREYFKKRDNDTIYWHDCSKGGSQIKNLEVSKQNREVIGRMCDQLTIEYADHTSVEYYDVDFIKIDPKWFDQFKRNDQYKVDNIEKSITLRNEHQYPAATIISTAVKVQREAVATDLFELPVNAILKQKE